MKNLNPIKNDEKIKCPKCLKEISNLKLKEHNEYDHIVEVFDHIFIGSKKLASNKKELIDNNIKFILNCTTECPNFFEKLFTYHRLKLQDSFDFKIDKELDEGVNFIEESLSKNDGNILVHCFQGKSRSATIIIAYLIKNMKIDTNEAYKIIKNKKHGIMPNLGFMAQLREYEKKWIKKEN